jgi:hypothetical protein
MADTVSGFPFWVLAFDEAGGLKDFQGTEQSIREIAAADLSDLFVFSHGWNNDSAAAKALYEGFFSEVKKILDAPPGPLKRPAKIGVAGVFWPSILWPDTPPPSSRPAGGAGGAVSLAPAPAAPAAGTPEIFAALRTVFTDDGQKPILDELETLLTEKKRDNAALRRFKELLGELVAPTEMGDTPDGLEGESLTGDDDDWKQIFTALANQERGAASAGGGGAAGLGDAFSRLWQGAKGALRAATYYQMKGRAGVVGKTGLGPVLGNLHAAAPALRIHLLGHSFGARLVSYALSGLPVAPAGGASPVKSLFLLQGAFSHFTFADALPFDKTRKGELAGMASQVDGPLLTTQSLKDLAVGTAYPLASIVARQDNADAQDANYRWEAMGHDGAQAVDAIKAPLGRPGTVYPFATGKWVNLDGNRVIVNGGPPSGAHSDILHPETAWAALAAAGIA